MTAPLHIQVGDQFQKWTVIQADGDRDTWDHQVVTCQCSCGQIRTIAAKDLKAGKSQGCIKCKNPSRLRHGHTRIGKRSLTHQSWQAIFERCEKPSSKQWPGYGGRGIPICPRWRHSFEAFLEDMGERPGKEYTIDRIDNDQGYFPGNCRWATRKEQNRNRCTNRLLTFQGEAKPVIVWAEILGMNPGTIISRLRYGWSVDDALTVPIHGKYRHHRFISGS